MAAHLRTRHGRRVLDPGLVAVAPCLLAALAGAGAAGPWHAAAEERSAT